MIRLRPSGVDEILIKRVQDWYEPGPGVFIQSLTASFSPAMLFTGSTNGVWYDPSDYSTLFQDAAGTQPVTAVEQPVGLMLDKSKGLVLGSNVMVGPAVLDANWTDSGGGVYTSNGTGFIRFAENGVIGKTYLWTFEVTSYTSGSVRPQNSSGVGYSYVTSTGTFAQRVLCTGVPINFYANAFVGSIRPISVRELPGNHAFNSSGNSANFPVLSARYNLLTKSEDFSDAAWAAAGVTRSSDGTITSTVATGYLYPAVSGLFASASGASYTWTVDVVRGNTSSFKLLVSSATIYEAAFDIDAQTVSGVSANTTASITNLGAGVYRCTLVMSAVANAAYTEFQIGRLASGQTLRLIRSDLRVSNDALNQPAYQRVNTSTDYDTVGFKPYLKFNGTNQWLQTNSIDFTYGDKMFVSAGVRKLSDAAFGAIIELSSTVDTNPGSFLIDAPDSANPNYGIYLNGTAQEGYLCTTYAAPITNVVTTSFNISGATKAQQVIPRVNGQTPTLTSVGGASAGTGNFGNYPLNLGSRNKSFAFFNGRLYQMVVAGKQASDAEITSTETYLNQKTGAY